MFDLKKEVVKIKDASGKEDVYEIGPLTGEYLEDFYTVVEKLSGLKSDDKDNSDNKDNTDVLKLLGTDVSKRLHRLVYASLAQAYPDIAKEGKRLDQFVAQNLMTFLPAVMKINVPSTQ